MSISNNHLFVPKDDSLAASPDSGLVMPKLQKDRLAGDRYVLPGGSEREQGEGRLLSPFSLCAFPARDSVCSAGQAGNCVDQKDSRELVRTSVQDRRFCFELIGPAGEKLHSFAEEKQQDPALTEAVYLERFSGIISTPEQWKEFEDKCFSQFIPGSDMSSTLQLELRRFGKALLGVDILEKSLEERLKLEIEVDEEIQLADYGICRGQVHPVARLSEILNQFGEKIGKYPPELLQNVGLKKVLIFDAMKQEDNSGIGGFVEGVTLCYDGKDSLSHEFDHAVDAADGGHYDDDVDWSIDIFGGEAFYRHLYPHQEQEIGEAVIISHRLVGYPSSYAKVGGANEHQAEIGRLMFDDYGQLMDWAKNEPQLAKAVELRKGLYYALSEGRMDAQYWQDLADGKVTDAAYWDQRSSVQPMPEYERQRVMHEVSRQVSKVLQEGEREDAADLVLKFLEDNPHMTALGFAFVKLLKDYPKAEEFCKEMIDSNIHPQAYLMLLEELYLSQGLGEVKEKLIQLYNTRISVLPKEPYFERRMAELYCRTREYDAAWEHLEKALDKATVIDQPLFDAVIDLVIDCPRLESAIIARYAEKLKDLRESR